MSKVVQDSLGVLSIDQGNGHIPQDSLGVFAIDQGDGRIPQR